MVYFARWLKARNMEIQFWGYEIGNVLAAISGAGGIGLFALSVVSVFTNEHLSYLHMVSLLNREHPDVTVTLGIVMIVLIAPIVRKGVYRSSVRVVHDTFDTVVILLATAVLAYALNSDSGWISVAGASFVVASSLLKHCHSNPFFLKGGGLLLVLGGFSLVLFGHTNFKFGNNGNELITSMLTIATGFYVSGAGLLTYEGGVYQTKTYSALNSINSRLSMVDFFIHPIHGRLAILFNRILDRPIKFFCQCVVNPSIFWISADTKKDKPFLTSMWARLPWRCLTGVAATTTGTPEGYAFALANIGWAIGDLAIGSEDWKLHTANT